MRVYEFTIFTKFPLYLSLKINFWLIESAEFVFALSLLLLVTLSIYQGAVTDDFQFNNEDVSVTVLFSFPQIPCSV